MVVSAKAAAGNFAGAGANTWYQRAIYKECGGGLTLFAFSSYGPGSAPSGASLATHEAAHTIQFMIQAGTISAGNRYGNLGLSKKDTLNTAYGIYLATGVVGLPGLENDGGMF